MAATKTINILPRERILAAPDFPWFSYTKHQLLPAAADARDLGKGLAGRLTTPTLSKTFSGPAIGVHFKRMAQDILASMRMTPGIGYGKRGQKLAQDGRSAESLMYSFEFCRIR
jgi:hypothetical protein